MSDDRTRRSSLARTAIFAVQQENDRKRAPRPHAGTTTACGGGNGAGFDASAVNNPEPNSERGRGLFLIKALSDNVRMQSTPRSGSLIHFEKSFALAGGAGAH